MLKMIVRKFVKSLGFELTRLRSEDCENGYASIHPCATYSPWLIDQDFQKVYNNIKSSTLVDVYRLYELWSLVEQVRDRKGAILEVGVWRGGTTALMAARAKQLGISATVFACDTFKGVVKAGKHDGTYVGGEHADVVYDDVISLFAKLKLDNIIPVIGVFPEDTASQVGIKTMLGPRQRLGG